MATPTSETGLSTCPTCHAPVSASSKFCNQCGSAIPPVPSSAAPPPPPPPPTGTAPVAGGAPVDIRQRVDQDRGILKRVQLLIPGFRGYRQGEDARAADSFLRLQVADRVHRAVSVVQDCRQSMTQAGHFDGLMALAPVLTDLQMLEGEVRHAEQGYSGVSAAVRVSPEQIDRLYEYDYGFVQAADQVTATLQPLRDAASGSNDAAVAAAIATVRDQVRQLDTAFKARLRAVQGILV